MRTCGSAQVFLRRPEVAAVLTDVERERLERRWGGRGGGEARRERARRSVNGGSVERREDGEVWRAGGVHDAVPVTETGALHPASQARSGAAAARVRASWDTVPPDAEVRESVRELVAQLCTRLPAPPLSATAIRALTEFSDGLIHLAARGINHQTLLTAFPTASETREALMARWLKRRDACREALGRVRHVQLLVHPWRRSSGGSYLLTALTWMERGVQQVAFPRQMDLPPQYTADDVAQVLRITVDELLPSGTPALISTVTTDPKALRLQSSSGENDSDAMCVIARAVDAIDAATAANAKLAGWFHAAELLAVLHPSFVPASTCLWSPSGRGCALPLQAGFPPASRLVSKLYAVRSVMNTWAMLSEGSALDLSPEAAEKTLGVLRSGFATVMPIVVRYLEVVEAWLHVFHSTATPCLSLVSRFCAHMLDVFATPCANTSGADADVHSATPAVEHWRSAVYANLRDCLAAVVAPQDSRLQRRCAAAELLDPRTVSDFSKDGVFGERRRQFAVEAVVHLYTEMAGARSEASVRIIEEQANAWVKDTAAHEAACWGGIPHTYMLSCPQYTELASLVSSVLGVRPDTTILWRAASSIQDVNWNWSDVGGPDAGAYLAMHLAQEEDSRPHRVRCMNPAVQLPYSRLARHLPGDESPAAVPGSIGAGSIFSEDMSQFLLSCQPSGEHERQPCSADLLPTDTSAYAGACSMLVDSATVQHGLDGTGGLSEDAAGIICVSRELWSRGMHALEAELASPKLPSRTVEADSRRAFATILPAPAQANGVQPSDHFSELDAGALDDDLAESGARKRARHAYSAADMAPDATAHHVATDDTATHLAATAGAAATRVSEIAI